MLSTVQVQAFRSHLSHLHQQAGEVEGSNFYYQLSAIQPPSDGDFLLNTIYNGGDDFIINMYGGLFIIMYCCTPTGQIYRWDSSVLQALQGWRALEINI